DFTHARMVVFAGKPQVPEQVVETDEHHVDPIDCDDLIDLRERRRALELYDDHGGGVERGMHFRRREGAEMEMREPAGIRSLAERTEFGSLEDGSGVLRRADMRRDHAECAAVEHAGNVVWRVGGNAHERRDTCLERGYADLAASLE